MEVKKHRGLPRDGPTRQPIRRVEQSCQPHVDQQAVNARGAGALRALVRAEGVPPQSGRQLKVCGYRSVVMRDARTDGGTRSG